MLTELYAVAVFAAEAPAHEGGIPEWIPRAVNLAIFLAFLYFVLRKPMASYFDTRTKEIKEGLERAQREKAEAEAKLAEVEQRIANLEQEGARIQAEAADEAAAEHERIRARAREEAEKIAQAAEREIGGALKLARADLQKFVAEKAIELAEATIRAEMSDADRERLLADYAGQLTEVKK